jgi:PAS domain S-box-containing protein
MKSSHTSEQTASVPHVSPVRLFFSVLITVALVEFVIMFLLKWLPGLSEAWKAALDALLIAGFSAPVLWFLVVRPLFRVSRSEVSHTSVVLEQVRNAVLLVDERGIVQASNPAATAILKVAHDQILGHPLDVALAAVGVKLPSTDHHAWLSSLSAELKDTETLLEGRRPDGCSFFAEISVSRIVLQYETGFSVMINDISKRRQAEIDGARAQAQFTSIVQNSIDAIIGASDSGKIEVFNRGAETIFGYSASEVMGRPLEMLMPPRFTEIHHGHIAGFSKGQEVSRPMSARSRVVGLRKSGEEFPAEISIAKTTMGDRIMLTAIVRDSTERERVAQELRAAKETAEAAVMMKSQFLANMSHEIRTPLNGVVGMTDLLLQTPLSERQKRYVTTIQTSGDTLMTVINDILDFSKIEANKLVFESIPFDLRERIEHSVAILSGRAHGKGLELACFIHSGVPDVGVGDPNRLSQVLTNLLGNAIKFTERGEVAVHVGVQEESENDFLLQIEVKDTGIGISSEVQSRLFQPFTQADASTTRRFGGTGLGLAISKELIELMHGSISVSSTPGTGTTFRFTVRLGRGTLKQVAYPKKRLEDFRLLIVDDNETNRLVLEHLMENWHIASSSAPSGPAALSLLYDAVNAGDPYSVVVLDMQMPEMDGLMVAKIIKTDPLLAGTKVIMLTSLGGHMSEEELRAAGLVAHIEKPVRQSPLFNAIETALQGATFAAVTAEAKTSVASKITAPLTAEGAIRILLAEDNPVNQEVARNQFEQIGQPITVVGNGAEAVAAFHTGGFDMIFMDCQMPELDGYEATQKIREAEQAAGSPRRIPIVAMTAHALQGDREKCLAAGMDDYISKPVRIAQLQSLLQRWKADITDGKGSAARTAAVAEEDPDSSFIDRERLEEVTGGDRGRLKSLLTAYFKDTEKTMAELEAAFAAGDFPKLKQLGHRSAGSSASLGLNAMAALFRRVEEIGGGSDLGDAPALRRELTACLSRCWETLGSEL